MLPHWPMAMYIGIPVARFVSEPRLCATVRPRVNRLFRAIERSVLTPCDDDPDDGVRPACDAEHGEVPDVGVIRHCKKQAAAPESE